MAPIHSIRKVLLWKLHTFWKESVPQASAESWQSVEQASAQSSHLYVVRVSLGSEAHLDDLRSHLRRHCRQRLLGVGGVSFWREQLLSKLHESLRGSVADVRLVVVVRAMLQLVVARSENPDGREPLRSTRSRVDSNRRWASSCISSVHCMLTSSAIARLSNKEFARPQYVYSADE